MHKNSAHHINTGVRDKPYDERSYLVATFRKFWPERGEQDMPGPYGTGLISFYTEGAKKSMPFGHTVDVADIILIEP